MPRKRRPRSNKTGRPLTPSTAIDPLLKQIFAKQEELQVPTRTIASRTGLSEKMIQYFRHPKPTGHGKLIHVHELRALAQFFNFKLKLEEENERPD